MSRISTAFSILLLCSGCQLSPFKSSEPPPPPPAQPAPVEKVIRAQRPTLDFAIESRIEDVLRLNDDQFSSVRVSTKQGVVTLTGSAPEEWYKSRLVDVVQGMNGVRRVVDRVEIRAMPATVAARTEARPAEESSFPWLSVEIAAVIVVISTLIWATRRRRPVANDEVARRDAVHT